MMQRQAAGIVMARALEAAGLDLERVELPVTVGVDSPSGAVCSPEKVRLTLPVKPVSTFWY